MSESKLSAETVARLRGLMERATPGPWGRGYDLIVSPHGHAIATVHGIVDDSPASKECEANAALIAFLGTHAAALLSAAEENERLRAALRDMVTLADAGDVCGSKCPRYAECFTPANAGRCVMLDEARAALAPADDERREP